MAIDLERLHRLQRLRRRLPGGEQHPGRRQGAGRRAAARCTGSASTATTRASPTSESRGLVLPAGAVHALRERAVRAGLPGRRDGAQRRRPERHGLQPLRRHALLLEQLPVQGAPLQLLPVRATRDTPSLKLLRNPDVTVRTRGVMEKCTYCVQRINAARIDAEIERSGPMRDGEIVDGLPAGVPDAGDRLRRHQRSEEPRGRAASRARATTALLAELNTRPRTTLPRRSVRNPTRGSATPAATRARARNG